MIDEGKIRPAVGGLRVNINQSPQIDRGSVPALLLNRESSHIEKPISVFRIDCEQFPEKTWCQLSMSPTQEYQSQTLEDKLVRALECQ